jgi:hypothetical protein
MECMYCNAELTHEDSFGTTAFINYGRKEGKGGDIFKCPNHEGFEDPADAQKYLEENDLDLEDLGLESIEELPCDGLFFYTDKGGNLHEVYPC